MPPKLTEVAPEKLLPLMVTVAPEAAEVGLKDVITGWATREYVTVELKPVETIEAFEVN